MPIRTNRGRAAVYRKLWGWPMRSPTHLVVVLVVVAVLVIAISVIVPQVVGSGAGGTGAAGSTGQSTSPSGSGPGTTDEQSLPGGGGSATTELPTRITSPPQRPTSAPAEPAALEVATRWGEAWVDHEGVSAEEWLDGLRPLTTEEYMVEMETVDPRNVPASEVTGEPEPTDSYTSSVTVNLPTDGGTLAITVIDTPQGWRVAFYEQVA
ncbi:hypothetical protein [Actinophytocola gossypii]|uniref:DUF4878 domain-containing protein n=1 Tax=Actinophytocola gossypii TaxID=2812003 RepID=A0ABT2JHK8_9PSEU|nr:hypothetical protein [Actinophytocola gossypii]MCT2587367.1 hypothetical protein [Actinophytocola gossypii]